MGKGIRGTINDWKEQIYQSFDRDPNMLKVFDRQLSKLEIIDYTYLPRWEKTWQLLQDMAAYAAGAIDSYLQDLQMRRLAITQSVNDYHQKLEELKEGLVDVELYGVNDIAKIRAALHKKVKTDFDRIIFEMGDLPEIEDSEEVENVPQITEKEEEMNAAIDNYMFAEISFINQLKEKIGYVELELEPELIRISQKIQAYNQEYARVRKVLYQFLENTNLENTRLLLQPVKQYVEEKIDVLENMRIGKKEPSEPKEVPAESSQ